MISLAAKTASIKEPKRSSALVRQETIASYLFLLPSLIFFLGFVIYPMILCVVTSFFDSTMNRADVFVGFANYAELFADPIFIGALRNTFIIVVVSVPVTCAFSLWVSSAIVDLPEWATSLFRCVFYLPVVTGSVAVTVAAVVVTGMLGNLCAPLLVKLFRVKDPMAVGLGIGACSHAMGTAKALELGETEGAMSGLAIGLCGILTTVLALLADFFAG